jgi:cell division protein FtsL
MIRAFYVLAVVVTVLLAWALYVAKTEAQSAQDRIAFMERGIAGELAQIAQLQDELAYLERPERLEALARVHLQLRPLAPEQDVTFASLNAHIATEQQRNMQDRPSAGRSKSSGAGRR